MEPSYSPGWYPDPARRFEFRYHNGQRWTADVSVNGQRYVDPNWASGAAPAGTTMYQPGPSRAMAITAFVVGLSSLLIAWVPFVFALAVVGVVVGVVFAVIALRRVAAGSATGKTLAVWGLVLSILAAPLCVVGFVLSGEVIREVRELTDPGPFEVQIDRCEIGDGVLLIAGTITNLDNRTHTYTIELSYTVELDSNVFLGPATEFADADSVAPGKAGRFTVSVAAAGVDASCSVERVNGWLP